MQKILKRSEIRGLSPLRLWREWVLILGGITGRVSQLNALLWREFPCLIPASTWEASKGKGVSDCVVWRRRRGGVVREPGVKWTGGAKETEALLWLRGPSPERGLGQLVPLGRGG